MPITFEQVSYSYEAPKKSGKRWAKKNREPNQNIHTEIKADWGNTPDAYWALRNIDFSLTDGEIFGIAGHTGSGKSTLIQHMNGLIHPSNGRVLLDGRDLAKKQVLADIRGQIGLVFQYPEQQLFAATVYDDIAFGPRNMGCKESEIDERVHTALNQVGLDIEEVSKRSPFELSGGQQRRVAFAGILAMKPRIFVLDEPTAGLDPVARAEFLDLIELLHHQGLTIVLVSHSMGILARLCDRILILNQGEQFLLDTPDKIFLQSEALRSVGLGVPAAQRLANSLESEGFLLNRGFYDDSRLADEIAMRFLGQASIGEQ